MRHQRTKTIALVGLFAALSIVLSALEGVLPPLPVPMARLGLANVAVTAAAALISPVGGLCVAVLKVLFVLFSRGVTAAWMAGCGTALALSMTLLLLPLVKREHLTYIGVSVASATAHTLGQLAAATLWLSAAVWSYAPLLLVCSLLAGCMTGLVLNVLIERLSAVYMKLGE